MTAHEARLFVEKFLRDLAGIRERAMKSAVLWERISALRDEDVAITLSCLIETIACAPGDRLGVIMSIVEGDAFAEHMGYQRVAAVYRIALESGFDDVARLFLRSTPRGPAVELKPQIRFPEMEGKTLGERKNLARRGRWQVVTRLLYDTNPEVVRNLLLNARIRETEVVKIAARRPNSPEILRIIAENHHWSARISVRRALVHNPHTPINLSLALATLLPKEDLLAIAADGALHPWLRERARRIMTGRESRRERGEPDAAPRSTDPAPLHSAIARAPEAEGLPDRRTADEPGPGASESDPIPPESPGSDPTHT